MKKALVVILILITYSYADSSRCQQYINQGSNQYKKVKTAIKFNEKPNLVTVGMTKNYMLKAYTECEGKVSDKKLKAIEMIIRNMQEMEKLLKK